MEQEIGRGLKLLMKQKIKQIELTRKGTKQRDERQFPYSIACGTMFASCLAGPSFILRGSAGQSVSLPPLRPLPPATLLPSLGDYTASTASNNGGSRKSDTGALLQLLSVLL